MISVIKEELIMARKVGRMKQNPPLAFIVCCSYPNIKGWSNPRHTDLRR